MNELARFYCLNIAIKYTLWLDLMLLYGTKTAIRFFFSNRKTHLVGFIDLCVAIGLNIVLQVPAFSLFESIDILYGAIGIIIDALLINIVSFSTCMLNIWLINSQFLENQHSRWFQTSSKYLWFKNFRLTTTNELKACEHKRTRTETDEFHRECFERKR